MENFQDDDFFMSSFSLSNLSQTHEAKKELSALASATTTKNSQFLNKP
ncbi:8845_t:CDS:2, partial [Dentiscutata erythropus]